VPDPPATAGCASACNCVIQQIHQVLLLPVAAADTLQLTASLTAAGRRLVILLLLLV
jgi:hypothetical protein